MVHWGQCSLFYTFHILKKVQKKVKQTVSIREQAQVVYVLKCQNQSIFGILNFFKSTVCVTLFICMWTAKELWMLIWLNSLVRWRSNGEVRGHRFHKAQRLCLICWKGLNADLLQSSAPEVSIWSQTRARGWNVWICTGAVCKCTQWPSFIKRTYGRKPCVWPFPCKLWYLLIWTWA